jgi:uncharacterized membrane protein
MDRPRRIYLVILSGALLWCAAIVGAPLFRWSGGSTSTIASILYQFFQPVCHQIDSRSVHLLGMPLAVCVRCSAIYGAFLLGTILYPVLRPLHSVALPSRWWLLGALMPMLLDVAAGIAGIHEITPLTRTVTGAVAGVTLPFFVIPVVMEAFGGRVQLLTRPEP